MINPLPGADLRLTLMACLGFHCGLSVLNPKLHVSFTFTVTEQYGV